MSRRSKCIIGLITVVCPLIIGAIFYYLMCPSVWFVQQIDMWLDKQMREATFVSNSAFGIIFRYYFFDLVWAFSLVSTLCIICGDSIKDMISAILFTTILGTLMELLQLVGMAQGTFDLWDIIVELIASMLGVLAVKNLRRVIR